LWYFPFLNDLDSETRQDHGNRQRKKAKTLYNAALAILYFCVGGVSSLPDPYWFFALLGFVFLLPAVYEINALNGPSSTHYRRNSRFVFRHYALIVLVVPIMALGFAAATGLIPSTAVVAGKDLSERQARIIREFGTLGQNERIDYYYSDDPFSYGADGNIVTDERAVSYYVDETGTRIVTWAYFGEILSLHVLHGTFFDPTVILVCLADDKFFTLFASTEDKMDRKFVNAIETQLLPDVQVRVDEEEDFVCEERSSV
jgi:hypothetical protein